VPRNVLLIKIIKAAYWNNFNLDFKKHLNVAYDNHVGSHQWLAGPPSDTLKGFKDCFSGMFPFPVSSPVIE
jgi:hypothetical protein